VRFEYAQPNPNLVIADGSTVAVTNSALKTTDRYPLLDSPFAAFAQRQCRSHARTPGSFPKTEQGLMSVTARENTQAVQGSITLTCDTGGTRSSANGRSSTHKGLAPRLSLTICAKWR